MTDQTINPGDTVMVRSYWAGEFCCYKATGRVTNARVYVDIGKDAKRTPSRDGRGGYYVERLKVVAVGITPEQQAAIEKVGAMVAETIKQIERDAAKAKQDAREQLEKIAPGAGKAI